MDVWTGALGSLLPKLGELLKEDNLPKSVKTDIKFLESELMSIHYDLDKLPSEQHSMVFKAWAAQVRELSYSMENVIDTFLLRMEDKEFTKKMANIKTHHQIACMFKEIRSRAEEVGIRRHRYNLIDNAFQSTRLDPRRLALFKDEGELVGIEETTHELIEILCEGNKQLKILSIVGFGGFGKTTLANGVYQRIRGQFDYGFFVSISFVPDMKKVFEDILFQLEEQIYRDIHEEAEAEDKLIDEIRKLLQNKRYLVVIDDLWNAGDWHSILCSLPKNDCGSRIITTTRVNDIAKICCSGHDELIYEIKPLGYQNSKRLFLSSCFGRKVSCHESHDALTEVVDEMWKICGGMPLAIISIAPEIGSFLARKVKEPWQEMMKSLHSGNGDFHGVENLIQILLHSYFDLPRTLRSCLLYLAASTKNQRIQMDKLVRKWIVEGLVPEEEGCSREEVASRYFDELINRNVIQPVGYGNCTYEVNYMMLYALRRIAREEGFATFLSNFDISGVYPIHLFIQCFDSQSSICTERMDLTNVRSVTMLGPAKWVSFRYLEYVRVLDLDGCEDFDNSAMDDICRMILLKYLSLKQTQVSKIPPQIINLRYLETLDVRQTRVKELPNELFQLPKLVNLFFGKSSSPGEVKLRARSDQLELVKSLGILDSRECSESVMEEISELTEVRELVVDLYDGPDDKKKNDSILSCIGKCRNLESLIICGDSNPSDDLPPASPNFPLLVKLKVAGRFVKVPRWVSQLAALQQLDIRVCKLETADLGILGKVPRLSSLSLALVAILPREQVAITSSAGFERLEVFTFDCRVPWVTFEEGAMPSLKHLQMRLYGGPVGKIPSGIMRLQSLNKIILWYSSEYASSRSVTETVAVMRNEAASHANRIRLSIN